MKNPDQYITEVKERFNKTDIWQKGSSGNKLQPVIPQDNIQLLYDFLESELLKMRDRTLEEERTRIALIVANAGLNRVPLLNNEKDFTGTYWISANMLYFVITGHHLNHDFDEGVIPRNVEMDEMVNLSNIEVLKKQ